ncbi:MAG: PIN domain-containing protein [Micrococcales bacterium]|nr:PIN domain-containing protein [Micrococcales bacterium]MCL2666346.1 PIN domain-containing protein [Micrococcales bacterium]
MTRSLLDANVLIALSDADHVHHDAATAWFAQHPVAATCPVTEGALVRFLVRTGKSTADITVALRALADAPGFEFWPDDIPYSAVPLSAVIGHRQVTDAYLVALARHHSSTLATFDQGLALAYPADVVLIASKPPEKPEATTGT